ncbi:MAG: phenylalanine--tRNA ligase subunit beta [Deltaproteobacteria bacterium]|nr:phenylalanine--tRNA ligase subunit beta [Deltaproteobacteria bacterium]
MRASYNWLRSLVPGLSASPREVGERLTRSGLEVEDVVEYGVASRHVVVARVLTVAQHPKHDKLTLVTVDRGGVEQTVVCGAPNVPAPGRKVVLAPLGTHLPAIGMTIAARPVGGVTSEGMLCSENELGLVGGGGKGEGILVFPEGFEAAPGTTLASAMPATHDFVFEIGVTPNRPDALGHVGLAREVAALFGLPFTVPPSDAPARVADGPAIDALASVVVEDTERCPHYGAAVLTEVKVGPSPAWLRYRLESLGVRSISNVVDVTNLVLLEYCQPLHAFDLDKLSAGRVVVRRARASETLVTLDGVSRELAEDDLLITDGERGIALAGVMGGADSEIGPDTRRVLLECAYFTPRGIRRASRRHGLHTEASHRYERGIDPEQGSEVLAHAAALLTRLAGAAAVKGSLFAGVAPSPRPTIRYRHARAIGVLGFEVPLDEASAILTRLGCESQRVSEGELLVTAPSFRPDLGREEDLIEEVMRVHGIDEVPAAPRALVTRAGRSTPSLELRLRQIAASLGLDEALTFGFTSPASLAAIGAPASVVALKNPLTEDRSVMRTSLLPGLLEGLRRSRRHGVRDARLFAVGRTFLAGEDGASLPTERRAFAAVLAGHRLATLGKAESLDVYDAKGVAVELVERVTGKVATLVPTSAPHLHPRGAGALVVAGREIGRLGPLHPDVVERLDLDGECLVIELDLESLAEHVGRAPQFRAIPQLPTVTRDLALVVHEDVAAGTLSSAIREVAGALCESVELFDLYRGKGLPEEHKSLAYRMIFRDPKATTRPEEARTLTDAEVDACTRSVVDALKERHGAVVRA